MKGTGLLFLLLTMSSAALMQGTSYAAPSQQTSAERSPNPASNHPHDAEYAAPVDNGKHETGGKDSNAQRDARHASDKNHPRSRASLTAPNHPKQLPNSRKRSMPGNAMNLHQPGSDKSGGVAKGGSIQNEKVNNAPAVRPPSVVRPTVASLNNALNNVRHRGPNPAVVGGSANLAGRNIGAINGTRMNRKP